MLKEKLDVWIAQTIGRMNRVLSSESIGEIIRDALVRKLSPEKGLATQFTGFLRSLREDQVDGLLKLLDLQQKIVLMDVMNTTAKITEPRGAREVKGQPSVRTKRA